MKTFSVSSQGKTEIIQAVALTSDQIKQQVEEVKAQQEEQQRLQQEKQEKLEKIKQEALAVKRQQALQQQRLAKLQAQRQAIALKNKQAAEQKAKLAALQKKKAIAKQKQQAELEKKRQLAQLKAQKELADQQEKAQLIAAAKAAQAKADLNEVDKYKAMIVQAISQHWVMPPNLQKDLTCQLLIKVAPGGVVLSVTVVSTSGNSLLDRSAETAVLKTSPLPVPTGPLFDNFRTLRLTVKPGIQGNKPVQIIL